MAAAGPVPYLQFGEFLWWCLALAQAVLIGYASVNLWPSIIYACYRGPFLSRKSN